MTQFADTLDAATETDVPSRRSRFIHLALRVALAVVYIGAALPKLTGETSMVSMFDDLGAGDPLRLFVGCAEIAGSIGLFVPRLRHLAALGLTMLMVGATVATIAILQDNPLMPAILGALAAYVTRAAWTARRAPADRA